MTSRVSEYAAVGLLELFDRGLTKAYTTWLRTTYRFASFGRRVSIHHSCDISKASAPEISFGDSVYLARGTWLNTVSGSVEAGPKIIINDGCKIGRRTIISAKNRIVLEADVLLAPSVIIMDHNHEFSDPEIPIHQQGTTAGGTIVIGKNCWLGRGVAIVCARGELTLGRNCVVGTNAVVTRSFPAFSVIAGNPAKVVKTYDAHERQWVRTLE